MGGRDRDRHNVGVAVQLRALNNSLLPPAVVWSPMADQFNGAANNAYKNARSSRELLETSNHKADIIEGSEGVTQEDLDTYRHVADRLPTSAWLVVFVEFAER